MFVRRRKRVAEAVTYVLNRFPLLDDVIAAVLIGDEQKLYEHWVGQYDTLGSADLAAAQRACANLSDPPLLAVVGLGGDVPEGLREQLYDRWELVGRHALDASEAAFVVFVAPHVSLRPHALLLLARVIEGDGGVNVIYADDDAIDGTGIRSQHHFKPDWNEALLRAQNYFGGFVAIRRSRVVGSHIALEPIGGDPLWAMLLEVTAAVDPDTIQHVPFVLSHRQTEPRHRANSADRRRLAKTLEKRLAALGEDVSVQPVGQSSYEATYRLPDPSPLVSIIVPTICDLDVIQPCLDGLLNRTSYPNFELILVVNGDRYEGAEQREFLAGLSNEPRARVVIDRSRPYNFSKVNNSAVKLARGDLICFLNDDTDVIGRDWLSAMVARVLRERVAAVGAKLLFPNGRIQHAGVILGVGHVAGHAYARKRRSASGYHERALVDHDVSCVTAACMVIRRQAFTEVGAFDETLAIAYNDIDLCLRLRAAGWRILWTPAAELYHRESTSTGRHDADEREREWTFELNEMHRRWGDVLLRDPHYNPNLSLDAARLWQPGFPPRVSYPWAARD